MRLITPRLILRPWIREDYEPFARLNADAEVMKWMPQTLTREQSDAVADRFAGNLEANGYGPLAVEREGEFVGFTGLMPVSFAPWVEISWRIAAAHQNLGYATEAAKAVLNDGFTRLGLTEIVAFTVPDNLASRRVMEKLGMTFDSEFDHPRLAPGHPLRRHVLYRLRAPG